MTPFAEFKKTLLADPAVRTEYDALEDEFALIAQQSEVAERMGTKQAAVARLEGGRVRPSLATLRRYAQPLAPGWWCAWIDNQDLARHHAEAPPSCNV